MCEKIKYFSIKELFSTDNYVIPIYQRNYAWSELEITQLIQDIVDYYKRDSNEVGETPYYYIGSLIAYERKYDGKSTYEIIDGQQRLTTLIILLSLLKNEYANQKIDLSFYQHINLSFDSRPLSTNTLRYLFNKEYTNSKDYDNAINQGYKITKKALNKTLSDFSLSINDFCSYFFDKVKVLRILVPKDTDLNHYFEIMNSRGEQLEKHEILKANMLEKLDEKDKYVFNLIWESCSNMERYVQYGFNPNQRDIIFGSDDNLENKWNILCGKDDLYLKLRPEIEKDTQNQESISNTEKKSIEDLLKKDVKDYYDFLYGDQKRQMEEENPDRFNTIINFANFLLHILRIQTKQDIPLDDKRLIKLFEPFLKNDSKKDCQEFVKQFGYNLLKGKFFLDKYIIKREFSKGTDHWSLKQLKWYKPQKSVSYINTFEDNESNDSINREILMLLSMFHVSTPTLVYKHWLNAALKYVIENAETKGFSAQIYKEYLENLAKAFLYDRFLAKKPKDYFEIIYLNNGVSKNTDIDEAKLNQGTAVENFIFNYLDYLLWQNYNTEEKNYFKGNFDGNNETLVKDKKIADFEYTFRSSVEHYYPQHPIEGNISIALTEEDKKQGKIDWLNNLGNLCLISNVKNSRLNNYMPIAKKDHYSKSPTIDSIKQRIMMEYKHWDITGERNNNEIEQHGNKMKEILLKFISVKKGIQNNSDTL